MVPPLFIGGPRTYRSQVPNQLTGLKAQLCLLHEVDSWHLLSDGRCSNEMQLEATSHRAAHAATVWSSKVPNSFWPVQAEPAR